MSLHMPSRFSFKDWWHQCEAQYEDRLLSSACQWSTCMWTVTYLICDFHYSSPGMAFHLTEQLRPLAVGNAFSERTFPCPSCTLSISPFLGRVVHGGHWNHLEHTHLWWQSGDDYHCCEGRHRWQCWWTHETVQGSQPDPPTYRLGPGTLWTLSRKWKLLHCCSLTIIADAGPAQQASHL